MAFDSPWRRWWHNKSVAAARLILIPFGRLEQRFIEKLARDQNQRVRRHLATSPPKKVLLIMPRCVKKSGCRADVQTSLDQCLTCMECPLGDVATLCRDHQVRALVAFRSHIAFDMARREKPDLILASACHDRMVKAWRSVPEVPALLTPLAGMEKMCVNATLDLPWLKSELAKVAPAPARVAEGS